MKKNYRELVITVSLLLEKDVLTLSGETGFDGFVIDRVWTGGNE